MCQVVPVVNEQLVFDLIEIIVITVVCARQAGRKADWFLVLCNSPGKCKTHSKPFGVIYVWIPHTQKTRAKHFVWFKAPREDEERFVLVAVLVCVGRCRDHMVRTDCFITQTDCTKH